MVTAHSLSQALTLIILTDKAWSNAGKAKNVKSNYDQTPMGVKINVDNSLISNCFAWSKLCIDHSRSPPSTGKVFVFEKVISGLWIWRTQHQNTTAATGF